MYLSLSACFMFAPVFFLFLSSITGLWLLNLFLHKFLVTVLQLDRCICRFRTTCRLKVSNRLCSVGTCRLNACVYLVFLHSSLYKSVSQFLYLTTWNLNVAFLYKCCYLYMIMGLKRRLKTLLGMSTPTIIRLSSPRFLHPTWHWTVTAVSDNTNVSTVALDQ